MIRSLGPREAEALIAAGGVDIVDVREPSEWAQGHVPGARLIPLATLAADLKAAGLGQKVLFVCAKGGRSLAAAELAAAQGVAEVFSLEGGTAGWTADGRPVVYPGSPEKAEKSHDSTPEVVSSSAPGTGVLAQTAVGENDTPPELEALVGTNVRELRELRGYSLDLLAGMSGVGRQTLGQIELGRTVPSLGTLWKIAGAFGVPFSVLLARPGTASTQVIRQGSAKRLVSADGRFASRALFPFADKGKVEFYELWLAAHGREDADAHAPGTRENLVVTVGRLTLEIGKERHDLAKGDAIVFAADVPHAYVNPGGEECWMNLVMTYV